MHLGLYSWESPCSLPGAGQPIHHVWRLLGRAPHEGRGEELGECNSGARVYWPSRSTKPSRGAGAFPRPSCGVEGTPHSAALEPFSQDSAQTTSEELAAPWHVFLKLNLPHALCRMDGWRRSREIVHWGMKLGGLCVTRAGLWGSPWAAATRPPSGPPSAHPPTLSPCGWGRREVPAHPSPLLIEGKWGPENWGGGLKGTFTHQLPFMSTLENMV